MQRNRTQGIRGPKLGILLDEGGERLAKHSSQHRLLRVLQGMDEVEKRLSVYPERPNPAQAETLAAMAAARRRIAARPAASRAHIEFAGQQQKPTRLTEEPIFNLDVAPEADAREQKIRQPTDEEPEAT